jgi:hypothetical protein
MTFPDADDLADIYDDEDGLAVASTYRVGGLGAGTPARVLVQEESTQLPETDLGHANRRVASIQVRTSEVAALARDDSFEIAAGDHAGLWKVGIITNRSLGTVTCRAYIATRMELGANGFRKVEG